MGKIDIAVLGGLGVSENTQSEYDNEVSEELFDHHLDQISRIYCESDDSVCYVLGMGAQPKATYTALMRESGIDVIWTRSILTGLARPLSFIVASHAGLIKILDPEKLPGVMKRLCNSSMAGIYVFDTSMERGFVDRVSRNPLPGDFDFGIKADRRYFFLLVDADNSESSTGLIEIVSYGKDSGFGKLL